MVRSEGEGVLMRRREETDVLMFAMFGAVMDVCFACIVVCCVCCDVLV